jgi:hypothetical protein
MYRTIASIIVLSALTHQAAAALINVGTYSLAPNTPGQTITLHISGNESVAGVDLFAQLGDGGPFNNGSNSGPTITNIDLVAGTPFAPNHSPQQFDPTQSGHPLVWATGITTNSGTVNLANDATLATFTIDTTGIAQGTFDLLLSEVSPNNGGPFTTQLTDGNGDPIPLDITNGHVVIAVPEPTVILFIAAIPLICRRKMFHGTRKKPTVDSTIRSRRTAESACCCFCKSSRFARQKAQPSRLR